MNISQISFSAKRVCDFFLFSIKFAKSPPSANSMTMQSELSYMNESLKAMILGCYIEARIQTSFNALSLSFSLSPVRLTSKVSSLTLESVDLSVIDPSYFEDSAICARA